MSTADEMLTAIVRQGRPYPAPLDAEQARRELLALGLVPAQLEHVTGGGLRHNPHCLDADTVLNKYRAGALSRYGVMATLFGLDSPQHHAGHNNAE